MRLRVSASTEFSGAAEVFDGQLAGYDGCEECGAGVEYTVTAKQVNRNRCPVEMEAACAGDCGWNHKVVSTAPVRVRAVLEDP